LKIDKVRIFALAKELDIDSKDLIQHCNDAGLDVKSSPLASITPAERDVLLAHLAKVRAPTAAKGDDVVTPAREGAAADRLGKVRPIRTLGPLGNLRRRSRADEDEAIAEEPPATTATAVEVAEAPPTDVDVEPEPPTDVDIEVDVVEDVLPAAAAAAPAAPAEKRSASSISRSDYVAPGGSSGLAGIREMKPRGSVRELDSKARKERPKKAPSLPSVATPNFKAPTPVVKVEGPAQKPEVRLTADLLKQSSPLASILKKHKDDSKKPKVTEEEEPPHSRASRELSASPKAAKNAAANDNAPATPRKTGNRRSRPSCRNDIAAPQAPWPSRRRHHCRCPCPSANSRKNSAGPHATSSASCSGPDRSLRSTTSSTKKLRSKSHSSSEST
jgi:translation initiation factor IF-2